MRVRLEWLNGHGYMEFEAATAADIYDKLPEGAKIAGRWRVRSCVPAITWIPFRTLTVSPACEVNEESLCLHEGKSDWAAYENGKPIAIITKAEEI